MNKSKDIYILTRDDLFKMLTLSYRDAQNGNSLDKIGIINEVLNQ